MSRQRTLFDQEAKQPEFGGATYDPVQDKDRLTNALGKIWAFLRDGKPRTLKELAEAGECSESGASARIRDLRKPEFRDRYPSKEIKSERIEGGKWVYWMVVE